MGFVCSTTLSLEHLYAQENSDGGASPQELAPEESLQGFQPQGSLSIELGQSIVTPGEETIVTPGEETIVTPGEETIVTPGEETIVTPGEEPNNPNSGLPVVPEPVKRIIDPVKEKFADPAGFAEDTFNTINENSPISISPILTIGIVAVIAIGAGVASFSRHHHNRSDPSPSVQHQVQQEDTREEQIYEDMQIVTQGGIEV
jgi:hypothetical protein